MLCRVVLLYSRDGRYAVMCVSGVLWCESLNNKTKPFLNKATVIQCWCLTHPSNGRLEQSDIRF